MKIAELKPGMVLSNKQVAETFDCGVMGGMRRSHKTNSLVLITDGKKPFYHDKWYGEVLHYTGMGKEGDQSLEYAQNKTLAYAKANGVDVYLFEVLAENRYTFRGNVELAATPFMEDQEDAEGNSRKVCIFPLKVVDGQITADEFGDIQKKEQDDVRLHEKDPKYIERIAKDHSTKIPSSRKVVSTGFIRDAYIAENARIRAKGNCQLCGGKAPFLDKDGKPYLEAHHIEWLSRGGSDSIDNVVALCPNCHRKMHVVDAAEDVALLVEKAKA